MKRITFIFILIFSGYTYSEERAFTMALAGIFTFGGELIKQIGKNVISTNQGKISCYIFIL